MNQMTINAIHTEQQTIRFKNPIIFTLQETKEEGIYRTEWPVMGFAAEGKECAVQQKIIEFLAWLYNEHIVKAHKNSDMLMQKRIEALFV